MKAPAHIPFRSLLVQRLFSSGTLRRAGVRPQPLDKIIPLLFQFEPAALQLLGVGGAKRLITRFRFWVIRRFTVVRSVSRR